jgi:hypothetical protein
LLLAKDLGLLSGPAHDALQRQIQELTAMLESLIPRVRVKK